MSENKLGTPSYKITSPPQLKPQTTANLADSIVDDLEADEEFHMETKLEETTSGINSKPKAITLTKSTSDQLSVTDRASYNLPTVENSIRHNSVAEGLKDANNNENNQTNNKNNKNNTQKDIKNKMDTSQKGCCVIL